MDDLFYILDTDGKVVPVDGQTWSKWFALFDRTIAKDTIGDAEVSTVFLGLDHGMGGAPQLFETMIFGGEKDGEQQRYSTMGEARLGHARVVGELRGKIAKSKSHHRFLRLE